MAAQAAEDALDVVDREHDATDAQRVHRRIFWLGPDRRRRVELVQLDPPVAVRGPHRGDRGPDAVEGDEAVDRLALDDRLALKLQTKFGEERFDSLEVVDDEEDVVHPQNGHRPPIGDSHRGTGSVGVTDRDGEVIRQLHAGRVVRAVAVGVLVQVLLVVVLGVVERAGWGDLRGDRAVAGRGQALLEGVA